MKVLLDGSPKEIAALVVAMQERKIETRESPEEIIRKAVLQSISQWRSQRSGE